MGCLQTLELKVDNYHDCKQLFLNTGQLRELTIISNSYSHRWLLPELLMNWKKSQFRPPSFNVIVPADYQSTKLLVDYAAHPTIIPTGTTANFKLYNSYSKVPLNFSPTLPYFQLQFEGSGQVTIPCVKLSDFGILGFKGNDDVALMNDCQCGGRTLYMVQTGRGGCILNKIMDSVHIGNLSCGTHFDFS